MLQLKKGDDDLYFTELLIIVAFIVGIFLYRNYKGDNVGKYIVKQITTTYDKFSPYSFKVVREKTKQLGQEYTPRQYMLQICLFAGFASVVTYLYFYNLLLKIYLPFYTPSFIFI